MMIALVPPQEPPLLGDRLLCGRCEMWWQVVRMAQGGGALQLEPSPPRRFLDIPPSSSASAEVPFCPSCGTLDEREQGIRFKRPVVSRRDLRDALIKACSMLDDAVQLRDDAKDWFPHIDQLRQIGKL